MRLSPFVGPRQRPPGRAHECSDLFAEPPCGVRFLKNDAPTRGKSLAHFRECGTPESQLTPNPSLKRSANGRPPGPGPRYGVHFLSPGPGVLPLSPA